MDASNRSSRRCVARASLRGRVETNPFRTAPGSTPARPRPQRYHAALPAGASSQAGLILALTLRSLVEQGGYDEADFCRRMDEELFPRLDGTPMQGPGGYASQSIREAWKVSLVYGMLCAIYQVLPAAYYLAARFGADFEAAVLHAVNGGGQNQARALLTGALVEARVGGTPPRLLDGPLDVADLLPLARAPPSSTTTGPERRGLVPPSERVLRRCAMPPRSARRKMGAPRQTRKRSGSALHARPGSRAGGAVLRLHQRLP